MVKLITFSMLVFFLIVPSVMALNLDIHEINIDNTLIAEMENPAIYELSIDNLGDPENVEIYSLVSVAIQPKSSFNLLKGQNKLLIEAHPSKELRSSFKGYYNYEYQIKGESSGIFKDKLTMKIVKLEDAISISAESFSPDKSETNIIIKNKENASIENVSIQFDSVFFTTQSQIKLSPFEEIKIPVSIDSVGTKNLEAGAYIITGEAIINEDKKVDLEGSFNYLEKEGISVQQDTSGILIRDISVNKTNEGNIDSLAEIQIKKDIITRLFTVHSITPHSSERSGAFVIYTWQKNLKPGESLEVLVTTNYTFPFLLVLLIFLIAVMAKVYYRTNITVTKRVSFVKTKDEKFALKVRISLKSKKGATNVQLIDRIPSGTKIYEKYGNLPDKIDHATRRLIWKIPKLNAGEERIVSYIIYSDLKILGKFELPSAVAMYESNGEHEEVYSNKTFFMNEASGN